MNLIYSSLSVIEYCHLGNYICNMKLGKELTLTIKRVTNGVMKVLYVRTVNSHLSYSSSSQPKSENHGSKIKGVINPLFTCVMYLLSMFINS